MKINIASYLPHQGKMCLLENVIRYDEKEMMCQTLSHQDLKNPLRAHDALSIVHAIEYAAQAAGLHLALLASSTAQARFGFLGGAQDIIFERERLDDLSDILNISATQLFLDPTQGAQYAFRLSTGDQVICQGKLLLVFSATQEAA